MGILIPTPTPVPIGPEAVNDIPLDAIIALSPDVIANIRAIYATGQVLGRNPNAFSKLGDSTIENPHFLARFDTGPYDLGPWGYLQRVIDTYGGSFARQGMAVRRGLHSWTVFDPLWADPANCQPNETVIACEVRLHNPSVLFVRLGSNDVGSPDGFERNLRRIVTFCMENGVVPILGTKADRNEGGDINNPIIRRVAEDMNVPLWDFDRVASTLPGRGLEADGVHLTAFFAHDWSSPVAYTRGHGLHSLTALIALDRVMMTLLDAPGDA
jgi:hypothetical protein